MEYTIARIHEVLHLPLPERQAGRIIKQALTDSRSLSYPEETLFVALITERQDGHRFIPELYRKGVRAFLVSRISDTRLFPEAAFIKVPDTLQAFQDLVAEWRSTFDIPVTGITGSNGKTIVKEWLYQLLADDYRIVRSPKSFNSQTGVPLSVAAMNATHQLGLFEAGISQPGEMIRLEKIIQPTIGIFTNIGEAHAEGFKNEREKIREKLQLFLHTDLLIYRADHPALKTEIQSFHKDRHAKGYPLRLFSWSVKKNGKEDLAVTGIQKKTGPNGTSFSLIKGTYKGIQQYIEVPFTDKGSIENAIHCWCLMLCLETDQRVIRERMKQLIPVAMRLEMKPGIQNCILINDSYNSDFASIKVALDFLSHQRQHAKRTLILSDIVQSGEDPAVLYGRIAELLDQKGVSRFIGIGKELCTQKALFLQNKKINSTFYPTTADFTDTLSQAAPLSQPLPFHDETILLKGARIFGFERIGRLLEQKKHQTELEINLNAIVHNLKTYQRLLKPGVRTMAMVKAFSYGSGSGEIAGFLQFHGVDYLAVANVDEGIDLRKNGITLPVLVLNPDPYYFDALMQWQLEPELYSRSIIEAFHEKAGQQGFTDYPVHIKLDTGMHRLGFSPDEVPELCTFLQKQRFLKIRSVFSHLAASEDPGMDYFTRQQAGLFEEMSRAITGVLPYPVLRHLANSSGISRHPQLQYDMVRLGIGLYGTDAALEDQLQVVHTLKTTISQIKEVPAGETIGYGRAGKADTPKRIAVAALGYADGYLRTFGMGKAEMVLHGKTAPTIGQICMDMLMLDVTGIPEAKEGDTVVVFGEKPRIEALAARGNTIPYEILTGLSQRIARVYVQE